MAKEHQQGSVLLVVLLVLIGAGYLILEANRMVRIDYAGAVALRVDVAGGSLLRSGLDIARETLLDDDRSGTRGLDHPFEDWVDVDQVYQDVSASLESGELQGTLEPEDAKLSLNAIFSTDMAPEARKILFRLVSALAEEHDIDADPQYLLDSILVWVGDEDKRNDDGWYASQRPPYKRPRTPFKTVQELTLVRWEGVEPSIYKEFLFGSETAPGLLRFVTVWGTGRINVNFAPRQILEAICPDPDMAEEYADAVEKYREDPSHSFFGRWYADIALELGVDMSKFPSRALDVASTVFRLSLTAKIGAGRINSTTLLQRTPGRCVVLYQNIH